MTKIPMRIDEHNKAEWARMAADVRAAGLIPIALRFEGYAGMADAQLPPEVYDALQQEYRRWLIDGIDGLLAPGVRPVAPARRDWLIAKTRGAYSFERYSVPAWLEVIETLLGYGLADAEIEWLLLSKHARWAADVDGAEYGSVPAVAFLRYLGETVTGRLAFRDLAFAMGNAEREAAGLEVD